MPPLPGKIKATIFDDSRLPKGACGVSCGINWSVPESVEFARRQVRERFGGEVELEYIDVAGKTAGLPEVPDESLALPLLAVNGKVRIAGGFDVRQLIDAIDAERELDL